MANFDRIKFFKPKEFNSPEKMDQGLINRLDSARAIAGIPFRITSSFREDDDKSHALGKAVDIAVPNSAVRQIIGDAVRLAGFHRVGIYDLHIHVDVATLKDGPDYVPSVTWWGKSK